MNSVILPNDMMYEIASFVPLNNINKLKYFNKAFYKAYSESFIRNIIKIQRCFRKHRIITVEQFENMEEDSFNTLSINTIRRFYFIHYPHPNYVISSSKYINNIFTNMYFENNNVIIHKNNIRRIYLDILNLLNKSDFFDIGY